MLKIQSITRQMIAGMTQPFLVYCDDSQQYVMKCLNNTTNGKALFNELFASRLANLLEIESPEVNIAKLPLEVLNSNDALLNNESKIGKCFVSKLIPGITLGINPVNVSHIVNDDIFPEIIFFDTLVMNSDRADNKGNWFTTRYKKHLIALDHTNIFRIAQVWNSTSLAQDSRTPPEIIEEIDDPSYQLLADEFQKRHPKVNHPFSPIRRKLKKLSPQQINSCFENIPSEWEISTDDITAANEFLCFQIEHSDDIVYKLEQKFGFNKGGYLHG
ncbi:HipA family kinase [Lactiplantibacillus plantarum]|uniref:HipA family kinase n=1 Tax=Lactiplantibacillus plantarum TaxID=1590 RepID=UPI000E08EE29|nr:HipA family kinase [Lactiplantibacillus plantarum]RDF94593.1 hypothetical protein DQM15_14280 [Lactiplantibacillus plantarum]